MHAHRPSLPVGAVVLRAPRLDLTPPAGFEPATGRLEGRAFADNKPVTATVLVIHKRRWVKTG